MEEQTCIGRREAPPPPPPPPTTNRQGLVPPRVLLERRGEGGSGTSAYVLGVEYWDMT